RPFGYISLDLGACRDGSFSRGLQPWGLPRADASPEAVDLERGGARAVGAGAVHDDAEACDKMSMSRATDDPIYLDNAGTSHPKPDAVLSAASKALRTAPTSDG